MFGRGQRAWEMSSEGTLTLADAILNSQRELQPS